MHSLPKKDGPAKNVRRLFVREREAGHYSAQLEGYACVGNGDSEEAAIQDTLQQVDELLQQDIDTTDEVTASIEDIRVVPIDEPLPLTNETTCSGDAFFIVIGKLNKFMHVATLSPPLEETRRHCTRMTPDGAVRALLNKNPGVLRKGNRLDIRTSGDTPSRTYRAVISFIRSRDTSEYVTTLDDLFGANTAGTPFASVCGLIRANPQMTWKGRCLRVEFPDELREAIYDDESYD